MGILLIKFDDDQKKDYADNIVTVGDEIGEMELVVVLNLWVNSLIIAFSSAFTDSESDDFIDELRKTFSGFACFRKRNNDRKKFIQDRIIGKKFWKAEFKGLDGLVNEVKSINRKSRSVDWKKTPSSLLDLLKPISTGSSFSKNASSVSYTSAGSQDKVIRDDDRYIPLDENIELFDFLKEADNDLKPLNLKDQEHIRSLLD